MAGELVPCEGCKRHVFAKDAVCPFCKASIGGGRGLAAAVALSAGLSLAGCTPEPAPVTGGPQAETTAAPSPRPPAPPATMAETAISPPPPAPAYGMPPVAQSASPAKSAKPLAQPQPAPPAPAYGLPPPRQPK